MIFPILTLAAIGGLAWLACWANNKLNTTRSKPWIYVGIVIVAVLAAMGVVGILPFAPPAVILK